MSSLESNQRLPRVSMPAGVVPDTAIDDVAVARGFWAGIFTGAGSGGVRFNGRRWLFYTHGPMSEVPVPVSAVVSASVRRGLFWSTLRVTTNKAHRECPGLPHGSAERLLGLSEASKMLPATKIALATWRRLKPAVVYLNHRSWSHWRANHAPLRAALRSPATALLTGTAGDAVLAFTRLHDTLEVTVEAHNTVFMARELRECAELFDHIETTPLTRAQRIAAITNEDNTLVVAGAGTGKTSVVVARVAYLVRRLAVSPDQILVLAYNKSAAEELRQRIKDRVGTDVDVHTFHALGLSILGQHLGHKPSLSKLAEGAATVAFVEDTIRSLLSDPKWSPQLTRYFAEYLTHCLGPEAFLTQHAHIAYLKGAGIVSLLGEQVRSHEECTIANWLFVNGIEYKYERRYEHDVSDSRHRQYKPDFYLVESGAYLEHFGVDRAGNTAPYVDRDKYEQTMAWKRGIHAEHGTRLVETYSYDRMEGALPARLAARLAVVGVRPKPRPLDELLPVYDERQAPSRLAKLVTTFMLHYKERQLDLGVLKATSTKPRERCFLDIFEHVHQQYQQQLEDEHTIDFQDMIRQAGDVLDSGHAHRSFTHVLVDEFQDLSHGRAKLLKSLLAQAPDHRLTCVGDDWQSIYRFNGSDISLMTSFAEHFGYTATVMLDETFRFGQALAEVSSQFISRNPAQLVKQIRSARLQHGPPVVICAQSEPLEKNAQAYNDALKNDICRVLKAIDNQCQNSDPLRVCLLGRYNHNLPVSDAQQLGAGLSRLLVEFRTVHGAKGLEADFIVVLDVNAGKLGFPNETFDDPLLSMILAKPDGYPHAEERRLFYVALTRSRRRVYLLTKESQRSAFVEELLGPAYSALVEADGSLGARVPCLACGGVLAQRVNATSGETFWGCADYPYCDGKSKVCGVCQRGALVLNDFMFRCSTPGCKNEAEMCPQCRQGSLVERSNRLDGSKFLGCSLWQSTDCHYTRDLASPAYRSRGRRGRR